jgi:hypothetical protein
VSFSLVGIVRIRKFLDRSSTDRNWSIFFGLDSKHTILYSLPKKTLAPLQWVQNMAVLMAWHHQKFDHITPISGSFICFLSRIDLMILKFASRLEHGATMERPLDWLMLVHQVTLPVKTVGTHTSWWKEASRVTCPALTSGPLGNRTGLGRFRIRYDRGGVPKDNVPGTIYLFWGCTPKSTC